MDVCSVVDQSPWSARLGVRVQDTKPATQTCSPRDGHENTVVAFRKDSSDCRTTMSNPTIYLVRDCFGGVAFPAAAKIIEVLDMPFQHTSLSTAYLPVHG